MRHFLASLDYPGKDAEVVQAPDPLIVGRASHVVHSSDHILGASLHPDMRRVRAEGEAAAETAVPVRVRRKKPRANPAGAGGDTLPEAG